MAAQPPDTFASEQKSCKERKYCYETLEKFAQMRIIDLPFWQLKRRGV
jgi:hypothetical protein